MPQFWILLSTYNGSSYLRSLIDSLRGQLDLNWALLVRDDGSSDNTVELLMSEAEKDTRIILWFDLPDRLGVTRSYGALMQEALHRGAEYFAFCDQDDIWQPKKISRLRQVLSVDDRVVRLAYSDLRVVDELLNLLHPSFFKFSHADNAWLDPGLWVLLQNLIPGCSMAGNRALLSRCVPVPEQAIIHDWWVLLCAASMGQVIAVPEPLILYRQHGANTIGAESYPRKALRLLLNGLEICSHKQQLFLASMQQNMALAQRLDSDKPSESAWRKEIEQLPSGLLSTSRWRRVCTLLFGEVRRVGWARNLLLLCVLLTLRARQVVAVTTSERSKV